MPAKSAANAPAPLRPRCRPSWRKQAVIHVCLGLLFASCWLIHHLASLRMEAVRRDFVLLSNRAIRAMSVLDFVAARGWLAIAYVALVFAAVGFLQVRGRPPWTHWLAALLFCIPCMLYWAACAYVAGLGKL